MSELPSGPPPRPTRPPVDRASLERDCEVEFFVASGPGGQHRNKTETGVRLTHRPTGVVVTATERRSQWQNRAMAFERMAAKLTALFTPKATRVPTRTPAWTKRRRLADKRVQSDRKSTRRPVRGED